MKLTTNQKTVQRSDEFRERTFRIAANSHAFEILSSRLYTDTCLAIVRELSTNAFDAQVAAGNADKPFDVHLPNTFAPFFEIRDYGTGLSPHDMEEVYTSYFTSTRNDSNEFVGALGLGSKSPFSHADQFMVTSYWNGIAYTYSAFKNEHGEPTIALMEKQETDEPNGLKVNVNVSDSDAYEFQRAASKVYRWFPVRPNITGARINFPEEREPMFRGDNYELHVTPSSNLGLSSKINVIMGHVCYAVSREHFKLDLGYSVTLIIHVDIGDCEIAANREELHYGDKTVEYLQTRLEVIQEDVKEQIAAQITKQNCVLDTIRAQSKFREVLTFAKAQTSIPAEEQDAYYMKSMQIKGDKLFVGRDHVSGHLTPDINTEYTFVHCDIKMTQAFKNRLRHWISGRGGRRYLVYIQDEKKFQKLFGKPTIKLSELPEVARAIRSSDGARSFVKQATMYGGAKADQWRKMDEKAIEEIDTDKSIAVPRQGWDVIIRGITYPARMIREIASEMGYNQVYGIATRHYKRLREALDLPDFEEEAEQFAKKRLASMTKYEIAKMIYGNGCAGLRSKTLRAVAHLSTACSNLKQVVDAVGTSWAIQQMFEMFGLDIPKTPNFEKEFSDRYPLLSSLNTWSINDDDVIEYIQLKENQ